MPCKYLNTFVQRRQAGAALGWQEISHVAALKPIVDKLIEESPVLCAKQDLLESVPGIGGVVARTMNVELPSSGAPTVTRSPPSPRSHRNSGSFRGKRRIQDGRVEVRPPLYMACLVTIPAQPAAARLLQATARCRKARPLAPRRPHAQAARCPQRYPARPERLGAHGDVTVESIVASAVAASSGSRTQAAAGAVARQRQP